MKKMRGFVDPISLGFIIIALAVGVAASSSSNTNNQEKAVKATVEAPLVAANK
jgi:hypothetical protein